MAHDVIAGIEGLSKLSKLRYRSPPPRHQAMLPVKLGGGLLMSGIVKISREKLYGVKEVEIVDEEGRPCKEASISLDDNKIFYKGEVGWAVEDNNFIIRGGIKGQYFDNMGNAIPSSSIGTVDENGEFLKKSSSNLARLAPAQQGGIELPASIIDISDAEEMELAGTLDYNIDSVYQIVPLRTSVSDEIGPLHFQRQFEKLRSRIIEAKKEGRCIILTFNYRESYWPKDAYFYMQDETEEIYLMVGNKSQIKMIIKENVIPDVSEEIVEEDMEGFFL